MIHLGERLNGIQGQRFDPAYLHQNEDLCSRRNASPRFSTPSKRQAFIQIRKSSEQLNSPSAGRYLSLTQERYRPFLFSQKNHRGNRSSDKLIQNNTPNDNKVIIRHKAHKGDESGRCTKRENSSFYSTSVPRVGERARRLQLGHPEGGGLQDRPRGNLQN